MLIKRTEGEKQAYMEGYEAGYKKGRRIQSAELRIVGETTMHYECSCCGGAVDKWDRFCKHCGAIMKGDRQ